MVSKEIQGGTRKSIPELDPPTVWAAQLQWVCIFVPAQLSNLSKHRIMYLHCTFQEKYTQTSFFQTAFDLWPSETGCGFWHKNTKLDTSFYSLFLRRGCWLRKRLVYVPRHQMYLHLCVSSFRLRYRPAPRLSSHPKCVRVCESLQVWRLHGHATWQMV